MTFKKSLNDLVSTRYNRNSGLKCKFVQQELKILKPAHMYFPKGRHQITKNLPQRVKVRCNLPYQLFCKSFETFQNHLKPSLPLPVHVPGNSNCLKLSNRAVLLLLDTRFSLPGKSSPTKHAQVTSTHRSIVLNPP